jgi:hypothetical protein
LETIEQHQKINKHQLTNIASVREMHINELLKEQKNNLIRKNHKLVMDCGPLWGDNAAQDYLMIAGYSGLFIGFFANPELTKESYAAAALTLGALAKVYAIYRTVRNNEAEMNKIDAIINAIEVIEQAKKIQSLKL